MWPQRRLPTRLPHPWDSPPRTLEWVASSFSSTWKWKVKVKSLSHVQLLTTPWTAAYQAPLSMGFSRQEYWTGVPLPSPKISANIAKIWKVSKIPMFTHHLHNSSLALVIATLSSSLSCLSPLKWQTELIVQVECHTGKQVLWSILYQWNILPLVTF